MRLKKKQGVIDSGIETGALVKNEIPRGEQSSQNNSQQLLPSTTRIMRVVKPLGDKEAALCKDLLAGSENVFPATELRPIHFNDLPVSQDVLARNVEDFVEATNTKKFARKIFSTPDPECFTILIKETSGVINLLSAKAILKHPVQHPEPPYKGALMKSAAGRATLQAYEDAAFLSEELGLTIPLKTQSLLLQSDRYGLVRELCRVPSLERCKASHNRTCRFLLPDDFNEKQADIATIRVMTHDMWDDVLCPDSVW